MQKKIPAKYILIIIAGIAALAALVDLAVHGGDIKATTATQIAEKVISATTEQYEVVQPDPVPLAVPYKEPPIVPFSITNDPTLLSGEGFFYAENGVLYRDKLENGIATIRGQKIAEGVQWVLAQNEKRMFFTTPQPSPSFHTLRNDLWVVDKETGTVKKIYKDVDSVAVSPKGDMVAVSVENYELHLIDGDGNFLGKVGVYGGDGIFSEDGSKIVYKTYPETGPPNIGDDWQGLPGLALYDIQRGSSVIITNDSGDHGVFGFSLDGATAYFMSGTGRGGGASSTAQVWSVNMRTYETRPLSPANRFTYIDERSVIWSSDRLTAISGVDDEITLLHIASDGTSAIVEDLGMGAFPRWKVQDKEVEFKTKDGWMTVDISSVIKE